MYKNSIVKIINWIRDIEDLNKKVYPVHRETQYHKDVTNAKLVYGFKEINKKENLK